MNCGIIVVLDREGAEQKHERFVMIDKAKFASLAANYPTLWLLCILFFLLKHCNQDVVVSNVPW